MVCFAFTLLPSLTNNLTILPENGAGTSTEVYNKYSLNLKKIYLNILQKNTLSVSISATSSSALTKSPSPKSPNKFKKF